MKKVTAYILIVMAFLGITIMAVKYINLPQPHIGAFAAGLLADFIAREVVEW